MKKPHLIWIAFAFLLLAACNGAEPQASIAALSGPNAWIDAPLSGANLPLAPYDVVSHATSPDGVASLEFSVNGQVYSLDDVPSVQYGQTLAYISQPWVPPAPGTYQLSVRAANVSGVFGPSAQAEVYVGEVSEEPDEEPTATPTPLSEEEEPVSEATSTPTPSDAQDQCTYTSLANLFCRLGPGSSFPEVDNFVPEQSAPVVGQSTDGFYWYVLGPNNGKLCTVPSDEKYGEVSGACDALPRWTPMPTSTPTPVTGCTVRDSGGVIVCKVPCPDGAVPGDACTP